MNSVTDIIKRVEQPRGGFLPIKMFEIEELGGDVVRCDNVPPIIVGKVVDSIIHLIIKTDKQKLFKSSLNGYAKRVEYFAQQFSYGMNYDATYAQIQKEDGIFNINALIDRLDDYLKKEDIYHLIICLCLIHQYDIWDTDFGYISRLTTIESSRPKYYTKGDIRKIEVLYQRTVIWIVSIINKDFRRDIIFDYKFYPDGYTDKVKYGVGDFVCDNTLFDLKCTKDKPTAYNTLQILIYYVMGLNSNNKLYKNIKYIGLYSPITNKVWRLSVSRISKELIHKVSMEVIGYDELHN